jgi:hypothetical protein
MRVYSTSIALGAAGAAAFLTLLALLRDYGERAEQAGAVAPSQHAMQLQVASLSKAVAELRAGLAAIRTASPSRSTSSCTAR